MKKTIARIVIGAVIISGVVWLVFAQSGPGKLDGFAKCLEDKGAVFYGAFWCAHCQNQKAMFGQSQKLLPYSGEVALAKLAEKTGCLLQQRNR